MEKQIQEILQEVKKIDSIKELVNNVAGELKKHDSRIQDLEDGLGSIETDVGELKEQLGQHETRIEGLDVQMAQFAALKEQNQQLRDNLVHLESYTRRSNLIFEGVTDDGSDPWTSVKTHILVPLLKLQPENMKIERCHRLQGYNSTPKPIIVRFNWYGDREMIWKSKSKLKGTKFFIREDFPLSVEKTRAALRPSLRAAKELDKKAALVQDKLLFKGEKYPIDNLPRDLLKVGPAGPGARIAENYVCFYGAASPLSNFYPTTFKADGYEFTSSEQYYQYRKALYSHDKTAAAKILISHDPRSAKQIGDRVKADKAWYQDKGRRAMIHAIKLKFQNHKYLSDLLAKCKGLNFAECSPHDLFWGNGLNINHEDAGLPAHWKGQNILGVCIAQALRELKL